VRVAHVTGLITGPSWLIGITKIVCDVIIGSTGNDVVALRVGQFRRKREVFWEGQIGEIGIDRDFGIWQIELVGATSSLYSPRGQFRKELERMVNQT
jgi:hypothetical protein